MSQTLNIANFERALAERGLTQSALAKQLKVSAQAVTYWMKGDDFPRPDKLLRLAMVLRLQFDELVQPLRDEPIVAFRKKASTKTTEVHLEKARGIGRMLRPLVQFLPSPPPLRMRIEQPSTDYEKLQAAVMQVRTKIGIGEASVLRYEQLISQFAPAAATLIPVLWGKKNQHANALHLQLPADDITFVFLNLDTRLDDFKFWMAHELAHVYTPGLAGTNQGEDFADAFAGALLFPQSLAAAVYRDAIQGSAGHEVRVLLKHAEEHRISVYSVYKQVENYFIANGLVPLRTPSTTIHKIRTRDDWPLVSEGLFQPWPPSPEQYINVAETFFESAFFQALRRGIKELGFGPAYIRAVLDIPLSDATDVHGTLAH